MKTQRLWLSVLMVSLFSLSGCTGKIAGEIQSFAPDKLVIEKVAIAIPVDSSIQIPYLGGQGKVKFAILSGFGVIDQEGKFTADSSPSTGVIRVSDESSDYFDIVFETVSKPQAFTTEKSVTSKSVAPLGIIGGRSPYTYELLEGGGLISSNGFYFPSGYTGPAKIKVTDSLNSTSEITLNVASAMEVAALAETIIPNGNLQISSTDAVAPVTYQIVSGGGTISNAGVFSAPSYNGTTVIKITDGAGVVVFKELTVSAGSTIPIRMEPSLVEAFEGQKIYISASGGGVIAFSKTFGQGSIASSGNTLEYTAPTSVSSGDYATLQGSDGSNSAEVRVNLFKKLSLPANEVSMTILSTRSFDILGGKAPFTVSADRGSASVVNGQLQYTAPANEGVSIVRLRDSLNQEFLLKVVITPALAVLPQSAQIKKNTSRVFYTLGGATPYQFSLVDEDGNAATDQARFGVINSAGEYTAPAQETKLKIKVEDAEGSTAFASVVVFGDISVSPFYQVTTVGKFVDFEIQGGIEPFTATITAGGAGGSIEQVSGRNFKYTALSAITQATPDKIIFKDGNQAEVQATVVVNSGLAATLNATAASKIAVGNIASLRVTGGLPPYRLANSKPDLAELIQVSSDSAEIVAIGSGSLDLTVFDSENNTVIKSLEIKPALSVAQSFVAGTVGVTLATEIAGGVPPYQTEIISGTGNISVSNSTSLQFSSMAAGSVIVKVLDQLGNYKNVEFNTQPAQFAATLAGAPAALTNNATFDITVGGAEIVSYQYALIAQTDFCETTSAYGSDILVSVKITETILSGDGSYRLCVRGKNSNGVQQDIANITQVTFTLDRVAPTATFVGSLPSGTNNVTQLNTSVEGNSVSHYKFKLVDATSCPSLAGEPEKVLNEAIAIADLGADGDKSLCLIGRDQAGNYQTTATIATWIKDTQAPSVTLVGVPSASSNVTSLNIDVNGTGLASYKYKILAAATCGDSTGYSAFASEATNIVQSISALNDGSVVVCVVGRDSAGNESSVQSASWNKDTAAPTISLTPASPTSPTSTSTLNVTATFSESVTGFTAGDLTLNNATLSAFNTTSASVYTFTITAQAAGAVSFSVGSGLAVDSANNSNVTSNSVSFTYDNLAPTGGSVSINSAASYTSSTSVSLALAATDATEMLITNNADCSTGGSFETYATSKTWDVGAGEGNKSVYVKFKDLAGNISSCVSDSIFLDGTAPGVATSIVDGNYSTSLTDSPVITFVAGSDGSGSGILKHQIKVIRNSDSVVMKDYADFVSGGTITGLTLVSGQTYKVQIKTFDNAGNSIESSLSDGWLVDTVAPNSPTGFADGTTSTVSGSSPSMSWTAASDASSGIASYEMSVGSSSGGTQVMNWTDIGSVTSKTLSGLTLANGATYYTNIRAKDNAGNYSSSVNGDGWLYSVVTMTYKIGSVGANGGVRKVAFDSSGNRYLVGTYLNNTSDAGLTKDFSSNQLLGKSATNSVDVFVAKLNASGTQQWIRTFGGTGSDYGTAIGVDASGNVHVGGWFANNSANGSSVLDFSDSSFAGFGATAGNGQGFYAKLDANGNQTSILKFGSNGTIYGTSGPYSQLNKITFDSSGNIYLVGTISNGGLDFSGTAISGAGSDSSYVAKLNSSGTQQFFKVLYDQSGSYTYDIQLNSNQTSIIVTGGYCGGSSKDFAGATIGGSGGWHAYVAKLDITNGAQQFFVHTNSSNINSHILGTALAVDSSNNIYVGGIYTNDSSNSYGQQDFAGANLLGTSTGGATSSSFVAKLNSAGTQQWIKKMSQQYYGTQRGVDAMALLSDNILAVIGIFYNNNADAYSAKDFSGAPLVSDLASEGNQVYLAKLDSSGTQTSIQNMQGGSGVNKVFNAEKDAQGNLFVGGIFYGNAVKDFSGGSFPAASGYNGFYSIIP